VSTDMVNSRCFILMKNRVRPNSQLFNSWGWNSWGKGWGVPLPSRLGGLREHHKLPQQSPSFGVGSRFQTEKRVLEYLQLEKKHTWFHFPGLFPDFFHFPWLFRDHFGIPWFFQVFQVSGHPGSRVNSLLYIHQLAQHAPRFHTLPLLIITSGKSRSQFRFQSVSCGMWFRFRYWLGFFDGSNVNARLSGWHGGSYVRWVDFNLVNRQVSIHRHHVVDCSRQLLHKHPDTLVEI